MYDPNPRCQSCGYPHGYHDVQTGACPTGVRHRVHGALAVTLVIVLAIGALLLWRTGVIR